MSEIENIETTTPNISKELLDEREYIKSPNLEANLKKFNIGISIKDPNDVAEAIVATQENPPRFEFKAFQTHVSTKEDPCVTLENMASYCSILVGMDKNGSVVSVHKNLIVDEDVNINHGPAYIRESLEKTGFLDQVNDSLAEEKMFFLTGTDFNLAGADANYRDWFIGQLEEVLGQPVDYLLLNIIEKPNDSSSRLGRLMQKAKGFLQNRGKPAMRSLGDLVIVPETVSKTGKTELVFPYVDNKYYLEYMVPFANKMKEKLKYEGK